MHGILTHQSVAALQTTSYNTKYNTNIVVIFIKRKALQEELLMFFELLYNLSLLIAIVALYDIVHDYAKTRASWRNF